jgi:single-stranded DNA-binding protein
MCEEIRLHTLLGLYASVSGMTALFCGQLFYWRFLYISIARGAGRSVMSDLRSYGWVTNDLEAKTSSRNKLYVRFGLAEKIGYGESVHTQYYDVWAWEQIARSLINFGVKKGSLIWIHGSLELVDCTKRDGVTQDKRMKVKLYEWRCAQKERDKSEASHLKEEGVLPEPEAIGPVAVVDGEREALPE